MTSLVPDVPIRPCCMQGTVHEGTPVGQIKKLGDVDCYVSYPTSWKDVGEGQKPAVPAILVYPDIFGVPFINTQLICDSLAAEGYLVVMVNIIRGAPMALSVLDKLLLISRPDLVHPDNYQPTIFQRWVTAPFKKVHAVVGVVSAFIAFLSKQGFGPPASRAMLPVMDKVAATVRAGDLGPVTKLGSIGFCFGGGFTLMHAGLRHLRTNKKVPEVELQPAADGSDLVDAFVVAHTQIKVPDYLRPLKRPGLFIAASDDWAFPDPDRAKAIELLSKDLASQGPFKVVHYPGTFHGFMTRGDPRNKVIQDAKEDGIKEVISWFNTHLKPAATSDNK